MGGNNGFNVLVLTGEDAIMIPALAVIGAASMMYAVGYASYKLGQNLAEKVFNKKHVKEKTES
jgi:hypothetical protein